MANCVVIPYRPRMRHLRFFWMAAVVITIVIIIVIIVVIIVVIVVIIVTIVGLSKRLPFP